MSYTYIVCIFYVVHRRNYVHILHMCLYVFLMQRNSFKRAIECERNFELWVRTPVPHRLSSDSRSSRKINFIFQKKIKTWFYHVSTDLLFLTDQVEAVVLCKSQCKASLSNIDLTVMEDLLVNVYKNLYQLHYKGMRLITCTRYGGVY